MATKLLSICFGIIVSLYSYSQGSLVASKPNYYQPKNAVKVPSGSYADSAGKIISVQSFLLTNQITNKEYRQFTNYVATNLDSSLYYFDLKKLETRLKDSLKKARSFYFIQVPFKQIQNTLIDTLAMAKNYAVGSVLYNKYKNYFTDKNFDDYPVVGVSWNAARYYCIWKSKQINDGLQKKGKEFINDFRIPTQEEFDYAKSITPNFAIANTAEVDKSKAGKADKIGAYHLFDNVDEWLCTFNRLEKKLSVALANKTKLNTIPDTIDPNTTSGKIGFRMVSTIGYGVKK